MGKPLEQALDVVKVIKSAEEDRIATRSRYGYHTNDELAVSYRDWLEKHGIVKPKE